MSVAIFLSYPNGSTYHEETEAQGGKMTHIKPHRSQKWGGDWNLGSLISLSKGILSRDSKGIKNKVNRREPINQKEMSLDFRKTESRQKCRG